MELYSVSFIFVKFNSLYFVCLNKVLFFNFFLILLYCITVSGRVWFSKGILRLFSSCKLPRWVTSGLLELFNILLSWGGGHMVQLKFIYFSYFQVQASHFEGLITTIVGYILLAITLIICHVSFNEPTWVFSDIIRTKELFLLLTKLFPLIVLVKGICSEVKGRQNMK